MQLRDLPPKKDPKGGSPKTPIPGSYQPQEGETGFIWQPHNGSAMLWRAIATGLGGLLVGMTVAWFTALQARGVSHEELRQSQFDQESKIVKETISHDEMERYVRDYVKEYTPWSFDKSAVMNRISQQDERIGELRSKIDLAADVIKKQSGSQR